MHLDSSFFIFDSLPNAPTPLKLTARRYTWGHSAENHLGLTLFLAHCIGAHKEQWEPTLDAVFQSQANQPSHLRIREAWAFDWQNHGDAAVLNREVLKSRPDGISIYEWSPAIAAFARSKRMQGHRIVPIGHSAGAGAVMLTTRNIPLSQLPYESLILIEPIMVTRELFHAHLKDRMPFLDVTLDATFMRRDIWPSRQEAFQWLSRRFPWRLWDPSVVKSLVRYGLEELPTGEVTLKCDKNQEAASYHDIDGHLEAVNELSRVCGCLPVHMIWGNRVDIVPDFVQDSLSEISQGRIAASVTRVRGAGHMVVQERPRLLAKAICEALDSIVPFHHQSQPVMSRL